MTAAVRDAADPAAIAEAAATIRRGGLVAFPTETVYGLGANALDARAVSRVFEAKRRPSFDPLIVHVGSLRALTQVADAGDVRVAALAARFWPGPLTLVLPRRPAVPDIVTSGLRTVGVRVPAHPAALALLEAAATPIAAPSANPFGYVSPTTAAHVLEQLGDAVDLILDGGACRVGVESTILSLASEPPVVLRPGGVAIEELEHALGRPLAVALAGERPVAPGQLAHHYATATPLVVLDGPPVPPARGRVGLLAFAHAPAAEGFAAVEVLAADGSLATAATNLFAALRRLDSLGLDLIQAERCPEHGLGRAILDRLRRAAARRGEATSPSPRP